jgi:hypothetical protein
MSGTLVPGKGDKPLASQKSKSLLPVGKLDSAASPSLKPALPVFSSKKASVASSGKHVKDGGGSAEVITRVSLESTAVPEMALSHTDNGATDVQHSESSDGRGISHIDPTVLTDAVTPDDVGAPISSPSTGSRITSGTELRTSLETVKADVSRASGSVSRLPSGSKGSNRALGASDGSPSAGAGAVQTSKPSPSAIIKKQGLTVASTPVKSPLKAPTTPQKPSVNAPTVIEKVLVKAPIIPGKVSVKTPLTPGKVSVKALITPGKVSVKAPAASEKAAIEGAPDVEKEMNMAEVIVFPARSAGAEYRLVGHDAENIIEPREATLGGEDVKLVELESALCNGESNTVNESELVGSTGIQPGPDHPKTPNSMSLLPRFQSASGKKLEAPRSLLSSEFTSSLGDQVPSNGLDPVSPTSMGEYVGHAQAELISPPPSLAPALQLLTEELPVEGCVAFEPVVGATTSAEVSGSLFGKGVTLQADCRSLTITAQEAVSDTALENSDVGVDGEGFSSGNTGSTTELDEGMLLSDDGRTSTSARKSVSINLDANTEVLLPPKKNASAAVEKGKEKPKGIVRNLASPVVKAASPAAGVLSKPALPSFARKSTGSMSPEVTVKSPVTPKTPTRTSTGSAGGKDPTDVSPLLSNRDGQDKRTSSQMMDAAATAEPVLSRNLPTKVVAVNKTLQPVSPAPKTPSKAPLPSFSKKSAAGPEDMSVAPKSLTKPSLPSFKRTAASAKSSSGTETALVEADEGDDNHHERRVIDDLESAGLAPLSQIVDAIVCDDSLTGGRVNGLFVEPTSVAVTMSTPVAVQRITSSQTASVSPVLKVGAVRKTIDTKVRPAVPTATTKPLKAPLPKLGKTGVSQSTPKAAVETSVVISADESHAQGSAAEVSPVEEISAQAEHEECLVDDAPLADPLVTEFRAPETTFTGVVEILHVTAENICGGSEESVDRLADSVLTEAGLSTLSAVEAPSVREVKSAVFTDAVESSVLHVQPVPIPAVESSALPRMSAKDVPPLKLKKVSTGGTSAKGLLPNSAAKVSTKAPLPSFGKKTVAGSVKEKREGARSTAADDTVELGEELSTDVNENVSEFYTATSVTVESVDTDRKSAGSSVTPRDIFLPAEDNYSSVSLGDGTMQISSVLVSDDVADVHAPVAGNVSDGVVASSETPTTKEPKVSNDKQQSSMPSPFPLGKGEAAKTSNKALLPPFGRKPSSSVNKGGELEEASPKKRSSGRAVAAADAGSVKLPTKAALPAFKRASETVAVGTSKANLENAEALARSVVKVKDMKSEQDAADEFINSIVVVPDDRSNSVISFLEASMTPISELSKTASESWQLTDLESTASEVDVPAKASSAKESTLTALFNRTKMSPSPKKSPSAAPPKSPITAPKSPITTSGSRPQNLKAATPTFKGKLSAEKLPSTSPNTMMMMRNTSTSVSPMVSSVISDSNTDSLTDFDTSNIPTLAEFRRSLRVNTNLAESEGLGSLTPTPQSRTSITPRSSKTPTLSKGKSPTAKASVNSGSPRSRPITPTKAKASVPIFRRRSSSESLVNLSVDSLKTPPLTGIIKRSSFSEEGKITKRASFSEDRNLYCSDTSATGEFESVEAEISAINENVVHLGSFPMALNRGTPTSATPRRPSSQMTVRVNTFTTARKPKSNNTTPTSKSAKASSGIVRAKSTTPTKKTATPKAAIKTATPNFRRKSEDSVSLTGLQYDGQTWVTNDVAVGVPSGSSPREIAQLRSRGFDMGKYSDISASDTGEVSSTGGRGSSKKSRTFSFSDNSSLDERSLGSFTRPTKAHLNKAVDAGSLNSHSEEHSPVALSTARLYVGESNIRHGLPAVLMNMPVTPRKKSPSKSPKGLGSTGLSQLDMELNLIKEEQDKDHGPENNWISDMDASTLSSNSQQMSNRPELERLKALSAREAAMNGLRIKEVAVQKEQTRLKDLACREVAAAAEKAREDAEKMLMERVRTLAMKEMVAISERTRENTEKVTQEKLRQMVAKEVAIVSQQAKSEAERTALLRIRALVVESSDLDIGGWRAKLNEEIQHVQLRRLASLEVAAASTRAKEEGGRQIEETLFKKCLEEAEAVSAKVQEIAEREAQDVIMKLVAKEVAAAASMVRETTDKELTERMRRLSDTEFNNATSEVAEAANNEAARQSAVYEKAKLLNSREFQAVTFRAKEIAEKQTIEIFRKLAADEVAAVTSKFAQELEGKVAKSLKRVASKEIMAGAMEAGQVAEKSTQDSLRKSANKEIVVQLKELAKARDLPPRPTASSPRRSPASIRRDSKSPSSPRQSPFPPASPMASPAISRHSSPAIIGLPSPAGTPLSAGTPVSTSTPVSVSNSTPVLDLNFAAEYGIASEKNKLSSEDVITGIAAAIEAGTIFAVVDEDGDESDASVATITAYVPMEEVTASSDSLTEAVEYPAAGEVALEVDTDIGEADPLAAVTSNDSVTSSERKPRVSFGSPLVMDSPAAIPAVTSPAKLSKKSVLNRSVSTSLVPGRPSATSPQARTTSKAPLPKFGAKGTPVTPSPSSESEGTPKARRSLPTSKSLSLLPTTTQSVSIANRKSLTALKEALPEIAATRARTKTKPTASSPTRGLKNPLKQSPASPRKADEPAEPAEIVGAVGPVDTEGCLEPVVQTLGSELVGVSPAAAAEEVVVPDVKADTEIVAEAVSAKLDDSDVDATTERSMMQAILDRLKSSAAAPAPSLIPSSPSVTKSLIPGASKNNSQVGFTSSITVATSPGSTPTSTPISTPLLAAGKKTGRSKSIAMGEVLELTGDKTPSPRMRTGSISSPGGGLAGISRVGSASKLAPSPKHASTPTGSGSKNKFLDIDLASKAATPKKAAIPTFKRTNSFRTGEINEKEGDSSKEATPRSAVSSSFQDDSSVTSTRTPERSSPPKKKLPPLDLAVHESALAMLNSTPTPSNVNTFNTASTPKRGQPQFKSPKIAGSSTPSKDREGHKERVPIWSKGTQSSSKKASAPVSRLQKQTLAGGNSDNSLASISSVASCSKQSDKTPDSAKLRRKSLSGSGGSGASSPTVTKSMQQQRNSSQSSLLTLLEEEPEKPPRTMKGRRNSNRSTEALDILEENGSTLSLKDLEAGVSIRRIHSKFQLLCKCYYPDCARVMNNATCFMCNVCDSYACPRHSIDKDSGDGSSLEGVTEETQRIHLCIHCYAKEIGEEDPSVLINYSRDSRTPIPEQDSSDDDDDVESVDQSQVIAIEMRADVLEKFNILDNAQLPIIAEQDESNSASPLPTVVSLDSPLTLMTETVEVPELSTGSPSKNGSPLKDSRPKTSESAAVAESNKVGSETVEALISLWAKRRPTLSIETDSNGDTPQKSDPSTPMSGVTLTAVSGPSTPSSLANPVFAVTTALSQSPAPETIQEETATDLKAENADDGLLQRLGKYQCVVDVLGFVTVCICSGGSYTQGC